MKEIQLEMPTISSANTVRAVWGIILNHPMQILQRWNYKSALFSSTMRASLFLATYLQFARKDQTARETLILALGAAAAQFAFRFVFAGVNGALIQAFRRVEPAWQALLTVMLLIPAISHLLEFLVQYSYAYFTGTGHHTDEAIVRSICFSIISALFGLFAMRRSLMIVGEDDKKSLWGDIKHIPVVVVQFIAFIPLEICKMLSRGAFLSAFISIFSFGVFSQMLGWAATGKIYWTYSKGKSSWLSYWGIDAIILLFIGMALTAIYLRQSQKQVEKFGLSCEQ